MARKKARSRKVSVKRRKRAKVGAMPNLSNIALIVGGAVAANVVSKKLSQTSNSTVSKVAPFSGLILGILLPKFVKRSPMIEQISMGLIAGGGVAALGSDGLNVIGFMNNAIAYPGGYKMLPYSGVAGLAKGQGLSPGTHSNFSGSRQSQINTIAGVQDMAGIV